MMRSWLIMAFAVLLIPASADALTLEEVLSSSLAHFPKIKEAMAKHESAQGSVLAAEGAFDATLENTSISRPAGYYDGNYSNTKLVKPIGAYNAKIAGGYRISDGSFPIYEDYHYTNTAGEFNLELFISLLRDNAIDSNRFALWNSTLDVEKAQQEIMLTKLSVQHAAMVAYYEWLAAVEIQQVHQDLVTLAKKRQEALTTRAKHGDIAPILVTENEQYLYRRTATLADAQRALANASARLALYLRDQQGNPHMPAIPQKSPGFPIADTPLNEIETMIERAYSNRPEFAVISAAVKQQNNAVKMGENQQLPRVDLALKTAQDIGRGSPTRDKTEGVAMLTISIPLQQRLGEGRVNKARAELKALEYEQRLLKDRIAQQVLQVVNDLQATKQFITLSEKEISVAAKMQDSEKQLFQEGASDFFVLNMREEQLANARIKNITAKRDYNTARANYYATTGQFKPFMI
jgi:outer membrane protein TolC